MTAKQQLIVFFFSLFSLTTLSAGSLSPRDNAIVIVARHLLAKWGTPELAADIQSRRVHSLDYWQAVFNRAGQPAALKTIEASLLLALDNVPLIQGKPPPPPLFAKAIVKHFSPLPLVPAGELSASTQQKGVAFVRGPLLAFRRAALTSPSAAMKEGAALVKAAEATFPTRAIADEFRKLVALMPQMREKGWDVVDIKDRLNDMLHLWGVHLLLDGPALNRGVLDLSAYQVTKRYDYMVLGTPFVLYEAYPITEGDMVLQLGHAETDQGFLFVFGEQLEQHLLGTQMFLSGETLEPLWGRDAHGALAPLPGLTREEAESIGAHVRKRVYSAPLSTPSFLRQQTIDTVGRHEGYHQHIEPRLEAAVSRWKLPNDLKPSFHETGAYLYQLEASDPSFSHFDLLMIVVTALDSRQVSPANKEGCQRVLSLLQKYADGLVFWDERNHRALGAGLAQLFEREPAALKKAAHQARWDFEANIESETSH